MKGRSIVKQGSENLCGFDFLDVGSNADLGFDFGG